MKTIIYILINIFVSSTIVLGQDFQFRAWNGTNYANAINFPSNAVAEDYGPRLVGSLKYHLGIDYNSSQFDGNNDKWDIIMAPEDGKIVDINRLWTTIFSYKQLCYQSGDHRYIFGHVYDNTSMTYVQNSNTIHLKNMFGSLNANKWAQILIINGDTTVLGQVQGNVLFNGDTLITSTTVTTGMPLVPLGNSSATGAHLHLNTIPTTNDYSTGATFYNSNPLEYLNYDKASYNLDLYCQNNPTIFEPIYSSSGQVPSPMALKVEMSTVVSGLKRYDHIFDVDKVRFYIKPSYSPSNDFSLIEGQDKESEIILGGVLGQSIVNHPNPNFGNWNITGVESRAYSGNFPNHPYDIYHYSDFIPRIRKDDPMDGPPALLASCPDEARYNDGRYDLKGRALDIKNGFTDKTQEFTLDNFQPYIQSFTFNANNLVQYTRFWKCTACGIDLSTNPVLEVNQSDFVNWLLDPSLIINVEASEPLTNLTLDLLIDGNVFQEDIQGTPTSSSNIGWDFDISQYANQLVGKVDFRFYGTDTNNNELISFSPIQQNQCLQVPYRIGSNNWNNTDNLQTGPDVTHSVCIDCNDGFTDELCASIVILSDDMTEFLEINGEITNASDWNISDGSIELTVSGGIPPYHIVWTDSEGNEISNSEDLTNLAPGIYCVHVTDAHCGVEEACYEVEVDGCSQNIQRTLTATYPCQTSDGMGSITMDISGGTPDYQVTWTFNGNTYSGSTITGDFGIGGVFYYTLTDNGGCVIEDTYLYRYYTPEIQSIITPLCTNNPISEGGKIDISIEKGAQPFTYLWSTGDETEDLSNITTPGQYSVTVTDDCGNTVDQTFEVGIYMTKPVETYINHASSCNASDGFINFFDYPFEGGVPPYTHQWNTGQTSLNIFNLSAGVYTLTTTDAEGCTQEHEFVLVALGNPIIELVELKHTCEGGLDVGRIAVLPYTDGGSGTPDYEVVWTDATGNTLSGTDDGFIYEIDNLPSGMYTVAVTDNSPSNPNAGCASTRTFEINARPSTGVFNVSSVVNNTCVGESSGSILLNVTGGNPPYAYAWNNGSQSTNLSGLSSGTYDYTITDDCGRTISSSSIVGIHPAMTVSLASVDGCPGEINLAVSGGVPPYNYSWSNGQTTPNATNLNNGDDYCVTITDSGGCTYEACYDVPIDESAFEVNISAIQHLSFVQGLGYVVLSPSPSDDTYTYLWDDGSTQQTRISLETGIFTATVTNSTGCSVVKKVEIKDCADVPSFNVSAVGGLFESINDQETTVQALIQEAGSNAFITDIEDKYAIRWEYQNGDFIGNSLSEVILQSDVPGSQLTQSGYTNIRLFVSNGCEEQSISHTLLVCGEVDFDEPLANIFISESTIVEPCKNFNDGSVTLVIPNIDDQAVTVTRDGISLNVTNQNGVNVVSESNLFAGTYQYQITIGNCTNTFQYELEEKPTTKVYTGIDVDERICFYDQSCDGIDLGEHTASAIPDVENSPGWPARCRMPLLCDGHEGVAGYKSYNRRTVRAYEYERILGQMLINPDANPFTYEYVDQMQEDFFNDNLSECEKVRYCPATLEYNKTSLLPPQYVGQTDHGNGCTTIHCDMSFGIINNYTICDHDLNVPQDILYSEQISGENACDFVRMNVYVLNWLKDNTDAFSEIANFEDTGLADFLDEFGNDNRAVCADVIYCKNNFDVIWHNINNIVCGSELPEYCNGIANVDGDKTCDFFLGEINDITSMISHCERNGCLEIEQHFMSLDFFPPIALDDPNPNEVLRNKIDLNDYTSELFTTFSFVKDEGILHPKAIVKAANNKSLRYEYHHNRIQIEKEEVRPTRFYIDDWDEEEMIVCYINEEDKEYDLTFYDAIGEWSQILSSSIKLEINDLEKEDNHFLVSGYYQGSLYLDGDVITSSNGSLFFLTISDEGETLSFSQIKVAPEKTFRTDTRTNNQTFILGEYENEILIFNETNYEMPSERGIYIASLNELQQFTIKTTIYGVDNMEVIDISVDSLANDYTVAVKILPSANTLWINGQPINFTINQESIFILKFSQDQFQWWYRLPATNIDIANVKLATTKDRDVFIVFPFENSIQESGVNLQAVGSEDIAIIKLGGQSGWVEWYRSFGSVDGETVKAIYYARHHDALVFGGEYTGSTVVRQIGNYNFYRPDEEITTSKAYVSYIKNESGGSFMPGLPESSLGINTSAIAGNILKVFPNPFNNELNVQLGSTTTADGLITITNIFGEEILSRKIQLQEGINTISLAFDNRLSNGVYFVNYYKNSIFIGAKKVVATDQK